jgi:hypothetical protein
MWPGMVVWLLQDAEIKQTTLTWKRLAAEDMDGQNFRLPLGRSFWPLLVEERFAAGSFACGLALEIVHRAARLINRELGEVGAAEALQLRVEVGEVAPLQQRIVREVDARHNVRVQNATCSVSEKTLVGLRSSTMRPMMRSGSTSSGISLVASSTSKSKRRGNPRRIAGRRVPIPGSGGCAAADDPAEPRAKCPY